MNVMQLDGRLLNFWVAKSAGLTLREDDPHLAQRHDPDGHFWHPESYNPARDWTHAGNIISEEWFPIEKKLAEWFGWQWSFIPEIAANPLVWFLRAYVAIQYGEDVENIDKSATA
jgi:hypothetical protein